MGLLSHDLQVGTGTAYAKEIRKWEAGYTQYGPPGRPFVHRDYPMMLYRASRPAAGGDAVFVHQEAEDETRRASLEQLGFVAGGPAAALEALERQEFAYAELAANRAFSDRKMSPEAQREADAKDSATIRHQPELPADPLPPRRK